jgi:hypothetical protein
MKIPSLNNQNELTWKCKLFGCKDELMPIIWQEPGEKHGIKGFSFATATRTLLTYTFHGCRWCMNFRKVFEDEEEICPKWLCDCEVCEKKSL